MNTHLKFIFIVVFLSFSLYTSRLNCQTNIENQNYYTWFDQVVGIENTNLFNGTRYFKKYRTEEGMHEFFKDDAFVLGSVTFDGQNYFNIPLKYDIYEDEIIANLKSTYGQTILRLNKAFISKFLIYNEQFMFISVKNKEVYLNGFYEDAYSDNHISLYIQHNKELKENMQRKTLILQFLPSENYFFYYNSQYYKINSKNDAKKVFPNLKKEINHFYKTNHKLYKINENTFMKELTKLISNSLI